MVLCHCVTKTRQWAGKCIPAGWQVKILILEEEPRCCLILPGVFDGMSKVLSCWPADLLPLYSVVTKQPTRRTMSRSMGQTSYLTHPHMLASNNAQSSWSKCWAQVLCIDHLLQPGHGLLFSMWQLDCFKKNLTYILKMYV